MNEVSFDEVFPSILEMEELMAFSKIQLTQN